MNASISQNAIRTALAAARREPLALEGYLHSAVLVPLVFTPAGIELLFTKRTENVETHKGQVSFPGGVVEEGDRDIIATALREATEEIGVKRNDVEVVGLLSDLATPTGFIITPVVAFLRSDAPLTLNWGEVAEVFHVALDYFTDPGHGRQEFRNVSGENREVWHYDTGTHMIWGATASIVRSLLDVLQLL
jgi:8-oxo-dGTP pyrophosphatase MutT (NUDIX family)